MNRKLLVLIVMSLVGFSVFPQEWDKTKLDAYFDTLAANNRFMGSVAIAKGGKVIYLKSVGFTDVERGLRANENSRYRIGSISKTFTAVLTLMAVEEGKLQLNQTIDAWFPSIPNAKKITIEHLLRHRSGLHNHMDDFVRIKRHTQPITEKEMVEVIEQGGSDFEPDTKTVYSNPNYILLTYILEKVHRKSFSEILEEQITKPLGLTNTSIHNGINMAKGDSHSYNFAHNQWVQAPEFDVSQLVGAGAMTSSSIDLVRFIHALSDGKLLSVGSVQAMKIFQGRLGMGLAYLPFYDFEGYGHTGGIDGFHAVLGYFPEGDISFAYTSNGLNFNGNDISIAILSAVYNKPYDIPKFETVELTQTELEPYLGVYSSKQLPLKMTITRSQNQLYGQGTGQSSFPLEATGNHTFEFKQAGVIIEFDSVGGSMILKQGGGTFTFQREDKGQD